MSTLKNERSSARTEGHNSALAKRLRGGNINFWKFLQLLLAEISFQHITYLQLISNIRFRKRSLPDQLMRRNGSIDLAQFTVRMLKEVGRQIEGE